MVAFWWNALGEDAGGSHPIFYLGLRRIGIVPPRRDDPPILIRVIRVIRGRNPRSPKFVSIRGYPLFGTVWNDGIDSSMTTHGNLSSRKIAFCGANGVGSSSDAIVEIDRDRIFAVFEKQMSTATRGKRTNPIRVRNLARFTLSHDQFLARHRSPLHVRCTRTSTAIDAMTIDQRNWPALQHVSCPAANASTSELSRHAWCRCRPCLVWIRP